MPNDDRPGGRWPKNAAQGPIRLQGVVSIKFDYRLPGRSKRVTREMLQSGAVDNVSETRFFWVDFGPEGR